MAKKLALALLAGIAGLAATPAEAAVAVVGSPATVSSCTNFSFSVTITACAGGYAGNLQQGSLTDATALAALVALGAPGTGAYVETKLEGLNATTGLIDFATLLTGVTVFGIHVGGAGDKNGQGTFFFKFDAGAGVDKITITDRAGANNSGLSNAALYQTGIRGVPEPATWALMLLGFGFVGTQMRRQRRSNVMPQMA